MMKKILIGLMITVTSFFGDNIHKNNFYPAYFSPSQYTDNVDSEPEATKKLIQMNYSSRTYKYADFELCNDTTKCVIKYWPLGKQRTKNYVMLKKDIMYGENAKLYYNMYIVDSEFNKIKGKKRLIYKDGAFDNKSVTENIKSDDVTTTKTIAVNKIKLLLETYGDKAVDVLRLNKEFNDAYKKYSDAKDVIDAFNAIEENNSPATLFYFLSEVTGHLPLLGDYISKEFEFGAYIVDAGHKIFKDHDIEYQMEAGYEEHRIKLNITQPIYDEKGIAKIELMGLEPENKNYSEVIYSGVEKATYSNFFASEQFLYTYSANPSDNCTNGKLCGLKVVFKDSLNKKPMILPITKNSYESSWLYWRIGDVWE